MNIARVLPAMLLLGGAAQAQAPSGDGGAGHAPLSRAGGTVTGNLRIDANLFVNRIGVPVVVSGGEGPANSPLFVSGTASGTGSAFYAGWAHINWAETMALPSGPGSSIDGLLVNHSVRPGAGVGNRNAIHGILGHYASTPGTWNDGYSFRTAVLGHTWVDATDGGTAAAPKGDFFGIGGFVALTPNARHIRSLIGAEFDVAATAGSSVSEKALLQLVTVNADAEKGSTVDAGLLIAGDASTIAGLDYGIVFGKPGSRWNTTGTLVGTYDTRNPRTAVDGVDFSGVRFSGAAYRSPGFEVSGEGAVTGTTLTLTARPPPTAATKCPELQLSMAAGYLYVCGPSGSRRAALSAW